MLTMRAKERYRSSRQDDERPTLSERILEFPIIRQMLPDLVGELLGKATISAAKNTRTSDIPDRKGERTDLCNLHMLEQAALGLAKLEKPLKSPRSQRASGNGISTRSQIKLDRLTRERPDLRDR